MRVTHGPVASNLHAAVSALSQGSGDSRPDIEDLRES